MSIHFFCSKKNQIKYNYCYTNLPKLLLLQGSQNFQSVNHTLKTLTI